MVGELHIHLPRALLNKQGNSENNMGQGYNMLPFMVKILKYTHMCACACICKIEKGWGEYHLLTIATIWHGTGANRNFVFTLCA